MQTIDTQTSLGLFNMSSLNYKLCRGQCSGFPFYSIGEETEDDKFYDTVILRGT